MDGTLEAVEDVRYSAKSYLKGFVVAVATDFAGFHWLLHNANLVIKDE